MNSLVSVIVPVYNCETYISDCLDSILNQSYKELEIIVVDDGSTDSTKSILDNYKHIENIKIVSQVNSGVSSARNLGIKLSSGKYVCFVDGDDLISPIYLEQLMLYCLLDSDCIPISGYQEIDLKGNFGQSNYYNSNQLYQVKSNLSVFFTTDNAMLFYTACNKLYLKSNLVKYNIYFDENMKYAEDFMFNLKYFSYMSKFIFISRSLYFYRQYTGSATRKMGMLRVEHELLALQNIMKQLRILEYENVDKKKIIGFRIIVFMSILFQVISKLDIKKAFTKFKEYKKRIDEMKIHSLESYQIKQEVVLFFMNYKCEFIPFLYYYYKYK